MAVFVSEGELTAVEWANPFPIWSPGTLTLYGGLAQDYVTIYKTQPAVRIVVDFLARNIADVGLHVYRRLDNDSRERLRGEDHPFAALMDEPNPTLTQYELLWWTVVDKAIFDTAFWVKMQIGAEKAIQPVPPTIMRPMGTNFFWPEGFRIMGNRGYKDLTPDQVVHFRGYDPWKPRQGVSPIETLRQFLGEDAAAGAYRENFWKNGAQATNVLVRPADAPEWEPAERADFRTQWQARFGPGGSEAGGTPILEDGMDLKSTTFDASASQYIETRKLTREEAASAYGVAPTLVGILTHATFSNIEAQHVQAYQDTLGPWFTHFAQKINKDLKPDFPNNEGIYAEFNPDRKLRGSYEERSRAYSASTGGPWMLRSEARAKENLPIVPGMDEPIVPLNVTQGGQASPLDTAPPPKGLSLRQEAEVRRFLERQKRSIAARLHDAQRMEKVPNVDDLVEVDRWHAELVQDLASTGGLT